MDRGAFHATVHGMQRVGHDSSTKQQQRWYIRKNKTDVSIFVSPKKQNKWDVYMERGIYFKELAHMTKRLKSPSRVTQQTEHPERVKAPV